MKYNKSAIELIKERHSVRTYSDEKMDKTVKAALVEAMVLLSCEKFRFELVALKLEEGGKIGTYGIIKGGSYYIFGIMDQAYVNDPDVAVAFGYRFEQLVLKATDLSLGTCWMAGTFNTKDLMDKVVMEPEEQIVMISPVGYALSPRGFERVMRSVIKANGRNPWESMFYLKDFNRPMSEADAGDYRIPLEMVRQGPSASNKQPWRVVVREGSVDFYLPQAMAEMKSGRYSTAYNDIGIATCHFEAVMEEAGSKGQWCRMDHKNKEGHAYVCSWVDKTADK